MGPVGHQRIAQRFPVATTEVAWLVPKRRGLDARSKPVWTEAAVIEISVMGLAIVCPDKWRAVIGTRVDLRWEGMTGHILVRREAPFPRSTNLVMYGAEFADNPSELGRALFERLVTEPAEAENARLAAATAEAVIGGYQDPPRPNGPALWAAPAQWVPERDRS